jgi:hypothetical protein
MQWEKVKNEYSFDEKALRKYKERTMTKAELNIGKAEQKGI